jgi:hypothetical protein
MAFQKQPKPAIPRVDMLAESAIMAFATDKKGASLEEKIR